MGQTLLGSGQLLIQWALGIKQLEREAHSGCI